MLYAGTTCNLYSLLVIFVSSDSSCVQSWVVVRVVWGDALQIKMKRLCLKLFKGSLMDFGLSGVADGL